jgi:hypothetical protein
MIAQRIVEGNQTFEERRKMTSTWEVNESSFRA